MCTLQNENGLVLFNMFIDEIPGPNFMALLPPVSAKSVLTDAGNSVLTASVFHKLAVNFGFYSMLLGILRLQGKRGIMIVSVEFVSLELGPGL